MLAGVLRSSGKFLSSKKASALVDATESFASLKEAGEIASAVKALARFGKLVSQEAVRVIRFRLLLSTI